MQLYCANIFRATIDFLWPPNESKSSNLGSENWLFMEKSAYCKTGNLTTSTSAATSKSDNSQIGVNVYACFHRLGIGYGYTTDILVNTNVGHNNIVYVQNRSYKSSLLNPFLRDSTAILAVLFNFPSPSYPKPSLSASLLTVSSSLPHWPSLRSCSHHSPDLSRSWGFRMMDPCVNLRRCIRVRLASRCCRVDGKEVMGALVCGGCEGSSCNMIGKKRNRMWRYVHRVSCH